ncbi:Hypothetical predicted protein, partial [Pelobates cultripes]
MAAGPKPISPQTSKMRATQRDGIARAFDDFWAKYQELTLQSEAQRATEEPNHSNRWIDMNLGQ